jgi:hypothetical protein
MNPQVIICWESKDRPKEYMGRGEPIDRAVASGIIKRLKERDPKIKYWIESAPDMGDEV